MLQPVIVLKVHHTDRRHQITILINIAVGVGSDLAVIGIQLDASSVLVQHKISVLRHKIPLRIHGKITIPRIFHRSYIRLVRVLYQEKSRPRQGKIKLIVSYLHRPLGVIRIVFSDLHTHTHPGSGRPFIRIIHQAFIINPAGGKISRQIPRLRHIFNLISQHRVKSLAGRSFFLISIGIGIRQVIGHNIHSVLFIDHPCVCRVQPFKHSCSASLSVIYSPAAGSLRLNLRDTLQGTLHIYQCRRQPLSSDPPPSSY